MDCHFSIFLKVSHSIKKPGTRGKKVVYYLKIRKCFLILNFEAAWFFYFLFIHIVMHPLDSSLPPSLQGKVQKIYR